MRSSTRIIALLLVALATAAYVSFLARHICYVAGGADSSGYLNQARLFATGHASMRVPLLDVLHLDPWFTIMFVPLGFHTGTHGVMVPVYPPGVSAIFAVAGMIGGWNVAPFLIGPLFALGCLLLMYAVARELGLPELFALAATALLAAFPAFILIAVQPVSDVIATFFALLTIWCALRATRVAAGAAPAAFWAGCAFAAGVAVRPMNALLIIALVLALRGRKPLLVRAAIGMAPIAIALLCFNYALYGNP
ncbi:MAG: glycosyltransferase family 39 protein, partial [Thermoanaerobaculia bacterium]